MRAGTDGAELAAALYDQHARAVRAVIVRVLGPDPEVPDLLQEVFVEALASLDRLEDPERVRAWLVKIAVHRTRNVLRARSRRRWFTLWSGPGELECPVEDSDVSARDDVRRVWALLEKLSADERVALCLRRVAGLELTEVAQAMDLSLATVKRRLAKAQVRFDALCARDPSLATRLAAANGSTQP